jgi:hypothetical protein
MLAALNVGVFAGLSDLEQLYRRLIIRSLVFHVIGCFLSSVLSNNRLVTLSASAFSGLNSLTSLCVLFPVLLSSAQPI